MKKEERKVSAKEIASFIYKTLQPFKYALIIMFFIAIAWAVDLSLRPYILKIIIDRVTDSSSQDIFGAVMYPALLYFSLTFLTPTIFRVYNYVVQIKMTPELRYNIANSCFESLVKQSYSYYQNNFSGSLSNKVNDLKYSIPSIVEIIFDRFFSHTLALLIAIFTLWQISPIFSLVMISWSAIMIIVSFFLSKNLASISEYWGECNSRLTGKLVDILSNIITVRLFSRDKEESSAFAMSVQEAIQAEKKFHWAYFWIWFYYGYSFVIVQGLSLYFLLKGRQEGWISVGDFVIVLSINFAIVDFLSDFAKDFFRFANFWGNVSQAIKAIQVTPEILDKPDAKELHVYHGTIVYDKVLFHYKGSKPLFESKSVLIEAGQKVGLVGYSGSGKTTFVNLILRLYEITDGRILIDGQNIQDVTQNSLHHAIGMIPQDPSLFHRNIIENIRYGKPDASDEEVIEAAKSAHAHEFITQLPEGYQSLVGERGVKLSGGQRQRIAIARAILKNAPILILDEATSQLDSVTENLIQESLWKLMQDKTTLIIAHRLSTLLEMDRILVFDQGEIVGDGTHQQLLKQEGLYKTLWDTQVGGLLPERKHNVV